MNKKVETAKKVTKAIAFLGLNSTSAKAFTILTKIVKTNKFSKLSMFVSTACINSYIYLEWIEPILDKVFKSIEPEIVLTEEKADD